MGCLGPGESNEWKPPMWAGIELLYKAFDLIRAGGFFMPLAMCYNFKFYSGASRMENIGKCNHILELLELKVELKVICQLKIYKIQMNSALETHICRKILQSGPKDPPCPIVLALQLARFRFNQRFWQSMSKEAGSGLPWSDSHSRTCTSFTKDWIGCKLCSKIMKWKNDNRI